MALVGDDCFFFLNSGCVRGSQCTFRHQPAARSTTVVCPQWLQRCCFHPNCVLRHTDDRSHRNQTPCYFESNMGVCYKPRCTFAHAHKPVVPVAVQVSLPVLPPHPPVLPVVPVPLLPPNPTIGVPPPLNLPLPNNTPVVRETLVVPEKPPAAVGKETVDSAGPQIIRAPLTPPPPVLPPPPKLAEMLLGTRLPLELAPTSKADAVPPADLRPAISTQEVAVSAGAQNVSILGAPPVNVFPKNEHFNEQVRLFKEMLASKGQKKYKDKDDEYSEEEKTGRAKKVKERHKERQRSKREHKEKEGHTSHKANKSTKEGWSKADEEILYGDYKDVPLDKKSKKKKRKAHKEHADSESEVKVKSYEEILREKALSKLYSNRKEKLMANRKEKFMEDFKELLNDNIHVAEEMPEKTNRIPQVIIPAKTYQKNKYIPEKPDKRKSKKYNSDGDEADYTDEDTEGNFKRRKTKSDGIDALKQTTAKKREEKRSRKENEEGEYHAKNNDDIKDLMLRNAIIDSQRRQNERRSKNNDSKKKKHRERKVDEEKKYELIEVKDPVVPRKEKIVEKKIIEYEKIESSPEAEYVKESSSDESDSDSDSNSDSSDDSSISKSSNKEIIIPDETTNIDFTVDHDDELAIEINQNEKSGNLPTKSKKISSVVSVINKVSSFEKNKYHKKSKERDVTEFKAVSSSRHHKCNEHDFAKKDSKSKDRNLGKKSPTELSSNNLEKAIENKKVVRLVNTSNEPLVTGRVSPAVLLTKDDGETANKNAISPVNTNTVKVKSFEEIMAEKQRRNKNLVTELSEVVSITDSPVVSKSFNATLKEKSIQAKLEILDVPKKQNGIALASSGGTKTSGKSKVLTDEEKQKRKSLQLYKPPHPAKPENEVLGAKTTEIKIKVNTGPRKIIRIRKASLSTDLIDQPCVVENIDGAAALDEGDGKASIKVRSFDEIIREKRLRQKKEREYAKQMEKEGNQMEKENASSSVVPLTSSSLVAPFTSPSNSLLRRKPVLRRHVPPITSTTCSTANTYSTVSTCSLSNILVTVSTLGTSNTLRTASFCSTLCTVSTSLTSNTLGTTGTCSTSSTLGTVVASTVSKTATTNRDLSNVLSKTVGDNKRSLDSNVAKVSPLVKVFPQKRSKRDITAPPVVATPIEALENKDFHSRLRSSSRRTSTSACNTVKEKDNTLKDIDKNQPAVKLRKRSITTTADSSSVSSNHVTTQKIAPYKFDTSVQSTASNETNVENHVTSRKDIQEALDEEKRKREQDILSDDEFEKEINELGSDDDGDDLDDINEDDLLMELEQMIDS